MTTRSQLLLLAATLVPLPLYAQEAAPAAPAAVAPAATPVPAGLATLSPLALIPADADAAIVLPHIGDRLPAIVGEEAKAFDTVAVSLSKGSSTFVKDCYSIHGLMATLELSRDGAAEWAKVAKEDFRAIITGAGAAIHDGNIQKIQATLDGAKLKPGYFIASIQPGKETVIASWLERLKGELAEAAAKDEEQEYVTVSHLFGLKFTHKLDADDAASGEDGEMDDEDVVWQMVEGTIAKRSFYLLFGMEDGHFVGLVCEDPSDIAFAKKAEDSVLANSEWQKVALSEKNDLVVAATMSADMQNAGTAQGQAIVDFVDSIAGAFEKMAEKDAANAEALKGAATGIHTITGQVNAMTSSSVAKKPLTFQIWGTEGSYHGEFTYDACGTTFEPWKPTLTAKAADPETIFTCECTPMHSGSSVRFPDCKELGDAGIAIFNGALASLAPELKGLVEGQVQEALALLPEASALCSAIGTIGEGMGGSTGLVVDAKAEAPAYITGGAKAPMARVAFVSGVTDRAKLSQGWNDLLKVAGDIMEKCGQDRAMLSMLPIVPATVAEGAISYSVAIPGILTPDFGANVTVSDTYFAAGSSAKLNKELVTTATGTDEFAGITFTLHTKPLATAARSLADAMLEAAGPIEKKRIYFDSFDDEDDDEEKMDDGEEEAGAKPEGERGFYEYEVPSESQRSAIKARNFAESMEGIAENVQTIQGTLTIEDDTVKLHVDVNLTEK